MVFSDEDKILIKKVCILRGTQQRGWQTNFLRKAAQNLVLISCWKSYGIQWHLTVCQEFEFVISHGSVVTCLRWGGSCHISFVANFTCFSAMQNFANQLRFDKVTDSLKVGTFLRHSVVAIFYVRPEVVFSAYVRWCNCHDSGGKRKQWSYPLSRCLYTWHRRLSSTVRRCLAYFSIIK